MSRQTETAAESTHDGLHFHVHLRSCANGIIFWRGFHFYCAEKIQNRETQTQLVVQDVQLTQLWKSAYRRVL